MPSPFTPTSVGDGAPISSSACAGVLTARSITLPPHRRRSAEPSFVAPHITAIGLFAPKSISPSPSTSMPSENRSVRFSVGFFFWNAASAAKSVPPSQGVRASAATISPRVAQTSGFSTALRNTTSS